MDGAALSAPLGPLPPMKIHCAQLVEGALKQALGATTPPPAARTETSPTLVDSFSGSAGERKVKVVLKPPSQ